MISTSLLEVIQLLVDFGMLVLIWMVQLVVYPGLTFYAISDLKLWHKKYTGAVTYIVLPLMMSQLILSVYSLMLTFNAFHMAHTLLVISTWILTFTKAVPLHQRLESSDDPNSIAHKLVQYNKMRALLWTSVFALSFLMVIYSGQG